MRKEIVIGLGAALATFAVSATEADASCRRACRCGPPPAYGYIPPATVYGYAPPPAYYGNGSSAVGYYYPPTAYGPRQPYANGPSYYGLPPPAYGYPPPRAPL